MFDIKTADLESDALQQHPNFAAALTEYGKSPIWLPGSVPMLMLGRKFLPGLSANMVTRADLSDEQAESLSARLAHHRAPLILSPDRPAPHLQRLGAVGLMTPATLAQIALSDPETMRAALYQKWRNRLMHSERAGLCVTRHPMPPDPSHWLFQAETAQRATRKYRNWPIELTCAYIRANPDQAQLFVVTHDATVIAGMLFLCHGRVATYHIGHTTQAGRALSAHNLSLWHAMCWLAETGHHLLDLGPIHTDGNTGLARFKLGTGAQTRPLGGTWLMFPAMNRSVARVFGALARLDRAAMHPAP